VAIPLKYNIGNLTSRKLSTLMTIAGIGVVIGVMVSMMALQNGVRTAIVSSGSKENSMVLREGALSEATSWVTRDAFRVIRSMPGIAKNSKGEPLISPELVILFKLPKKDNPKGSNVNVRGITPMAFELRPEIKLIEGRMFRPGTNEIIVSKRVQERFVNVDMNQRFKFGPREWTVVGVFDGKGTSFDSEMWTDVDYLGLAQKREQYSVVLLKPENSAAAASIRDSIKGDNRLKLNVKSEYDYYAEQTQGLKGIVILVRFVTVFMVIGAILGAMNSMFSAIASRGRELATMRALGFKRRAILLSIVIEAAFIGVLGGIAGVLFALPVNGIATGTTNFQTFAEVAFNFKISPEIAIFAITLAVVAGIIGGLIPALLASRLPITTALREI